MSTPPAKPSVRLLVSQNRIVLREVVVMLVHVLVHVVVLHLPRLWLWLCLWWRWRRRKVGWGGGRLITAVVTRFRLWGCRRVLPLQPPENLLHGAVVVPLTAASGGAEIRRREGQHPVAPAEVSAPANSRRQGALTRRSAEPPPECAPRGSLRRAEVGVSSARNEPF